MRKVFAVLAGAAISVAAFGAASAQQSSAISNPRGMVDNFDAVSTSCPLNPNTVLCILNELGLTAQVAQSPDGQNYIQANYGGRITFNLIPTACLNSGVSNCVGLNILALFSGSDFNAQTVSAFNQRYSFTSAGVLSDSSGAYVTRYEIADYGIPRGNLASSIGNFLVLTERFMGEVQTSTQTVSQDGFADDMAARALNGQVLSQMDGASEVEKTRLELHQAGFEQAPELVKILLNDEATPRNKIRNITAE